MGLICVIIVFIVVLACFRFTKLDFFLVSFLPLFIILILKASLEYQSLWKNMFNLSLKHIFWLIITILIIIPLIALSLKFLYVIILKKDRRITKCITRISDVDDSIVSYIVTYIIPLTSLTYNSSMSDYIANILLFSVVMIIYIRMDLIYLNPFFILIGLNVYKVTIDNQVKFLLTNATFGQLNSKIKDSEELIKLVKISNNLFFKWFKKNK